MNWKAERVMGSPLLSAYYGGASMVEGYYRSQMYADIEEKLGADIFSVIDEYNDIKTFGSPAEQKTYYAQNKKKIKQYYSLKDEWSITINRNVADITAHLPEGENAGIRDDYDATSPLQNQLAGAVQPQAQQVDLQRVLDSRIQNLLVDYFQNGEALPESARKQLERLAREYNFYDADDLIQNYGRSLQGQR
jgi:hypothetical protein